jgi:hypothetical protein
MSTGYIFFFLKASPMSNYSGETATTIRRSLACGETERESIACQGGRDAEANDTQDSWFACTVFSLKIHYSSQFVSASSGPAPKVRVPSRELEKLKAYGGNLLCGAPHLNGNGRSARSEGSSDENEFGEERYGCRESVEVLTRNPKKGETYHAIVTCVIVSIFL